MEASGSTIVWVIAQTMVHDVDQWFQEFMPALGPRQMKRLWHEHQFQYWAGWIDDLEKQHFIMQSSNMEERMPGVCGHGK